MRTFVLAASLLIASAAFAGVQPNLAFTEIGHYAWSESYRVALVEGGKEIPLTIETLDAHARITMSNDSSLQSSGEPHYDAKTRRVTIGSRIGSEDFIAQTYRLDVAQRRLVLLSEELSSLDGETGEQKTTKTWHRPKDNN